MFDIDSDPIQLEGIGPQNPRAEKPYCRVHYCEMEQYAKSKNKERVHYRCKVKTCKETAAVILEEAKIPKAPTICPVCGETLIVGRYKQYFVLLQCPATIGKGKSAYECGFELEVARPDIAQRTARARARDVENIF